MNRLPEAAPAADHEAIDVARFWIDGARHDVEAVERLVRDDSFVPRHACVLANVAVRRALTALLSLSRTPFSRRHDLDALLALLPPDSIVRRDVPELRDLAQWAAEPRFPGDWQEATVEDALRAAGCARTVLEAALADLFERGIRA